MSTRVGTISFLIGFRNLTVLRAEPRSRELRAESSIDRLRSREAIYNQSRQRFGRRRVSGSNTLQAALAARCHAGSSATPHPWTTPRIGSPADVVVDVAAKAVRLPPDRLTQLSTPVAALTARATAQPRRATGITVTAQPSPAARMGAQVLRGCADDPSRAGAEGLASVAAARTQI